MAKGPRFIRKGSILTEIKNTSVIEFDDISDEQMNQMIDGTLTEFDEGDLVDGTVVKIEGAQNDASRRIVVSPNDAATSLEEVLVVTSASESSSDSSSSSSSSSSQSKSSSSTGGAQ